MEEIRKKIFPWNVLVEAATWIVMIVIIFGVRFLPSDPIGDDYSLIFVVVIITFALLYYFVIQRYLTKNQSEYLKIITDILLISVLIHLLKDYGQYMFALYFLPIAAAALCLQFTSALVIAAIASFIVALEILLGSLGLLSVSVNVYQGIWQIVLIL